MTGILQGNESLVEIARQGRPASSHSQMWLSMTYGAITCEHGRCCFLDYSKEIAFEQNQSTGMASASPLL